MFNVHILEILQLQKAYNILRNLLWLYDNDNDNVCCQGRKIRYKQVSYITLFAIILQWQRAEHYKVYVPSPHTKAPKHV